MKSLTKIGIYLVALYLFFLIDNRIFDFLFSGLLFFLAIFILAIEALRGFGFPFSKIDNFLNNIIVKFGFKEIESYSDFFAFLFLQIILIGFIGFVFYAIDVFLLR